MSYFIPGVEAQEIDWMKVDLLDACFDPMFENMGLDGFREISMVEAQAEALQSEPSMVNNVLSGTAQLSTQALNQNAPNHTSAVVESSKYQCYTCGEQRNSDWSLSWHASQKQHPAFDCIFTGCNQTFIDYREHVAHVKWPHVSGHARVAMPNPNDCIECNYSCKTKADLLRHAKRRQHQPYGCECGARFSRLDVLKRHLNSYSTSEPKYPCKYCKRHRGADGFRRQDHLMQHIQNYHHHETENSGDKTASSSRMKYTFPVCPHPDCPQHRGDDYKGLSRIAQLKSKPFASQSAFTKHMREEHNESIYPCDVSGCSRVGRRGYFREKDLIKHRKEQHPDANGYEVTHRDTHVQCLETGCGVWLDPSSLRDHYYQTHRQHPYYLGWRAELKIIDA